MDNKILDLVRKLIAMQQSATAIGSMEEAQAFAVKAQSLMDEHKIGMSDVEYAQRELEEPIGFSDYSGPECYSGGPGKRQLWTRNLANAIAEANECEMVLAGKTNQFAFVGRTTSREFCVMMFQYMYTLAAELADKSVQQNKDEQHDLYMEQYDYSMNRAAGFRHWIKAYRKSWLNGFARAIEIRLQAQTQQRNLAAHPGAIVHISKDAQAAEDFINELLANGTFKKKKTRAHIANQAAYGEGARVGHSVALTPHTFSGGSRASSSRLLPA